MHRGDHLSLPFVSRGGCPRPEVSESFVLDTSRPSPVPSPPPLPAPVQLRSRPRRLLGSCARLSCMLPPSVPSGLSPPLSNQTPHVPLALAPSLWFLYYTASEAQFCSGNLLVSPFLLQASQMSPCPWERCPHPNAPDVQPKPSLAPCIPSFTSLPASVPAAGRLSPALPESTAPPRGPPRGSPPRSSTSAQALCLLDAARSSLAQQAHPGRPEQGVPAPRHCGISQLPSLAPRTAVEGVCWALAFPGSLTVGRTHTALLMPADCPRPRGAWVSSGHLGLCNQRAGAWSCSHEQQPQVCYYGDGACGPGWFLVVPVGCLRWQW